MVLNAKTQMEDTEIWVKFAGYTKVEGKLMRFVEEDKMLRKARCKLYPSLRGKDMGRWLMR